MFTLINEHGKYLKVRRGQSLTELENELGAPVAGELFAGRIIERGQRCGVYFVKPLDSYKVIAEKLGVDEGELRKLNGDKRIYPKLRLFVPCTKSGASI